MQVIQIMFWDKFTYIQDDSKIDEFAATNKLLSTVTTPFMNNLLAHEA